jgi:hypothetical protein
MNLSDFTLAGPIRRKAGLMRRGGRVLVSGRIGRSPHTLLVLPDVIAGRDDENERCPDRQKNVYSATHDVLRTGTSIGCAGAHRQTCRCEDFRLANGEWFASSTNARSIGTVWREGGEAAETRSLNTDQADQPRRRALRTAVFRRE